MPNWTYQTKSNYQAYWTKPTKPKLLVKAVNAWVRSAFGNVFLSVHAPATSAGPIKTKVDQNFSGLNKPLPTFNKDNYFKELWLSPAHAILAILLCPSVSVHAEFCSVAAVVSRAAAAAASPRLPPGGARCTGRLPRARPDPQIREIRELAGRSSTHQLAIWTKRPEKLLRINSWVCPMPLRA